MTDAALLLAATSKTPFYIAAGVLVVFAILVSLLGLSRGSFGASGGLSSAVMGVGVVLVAAAMVTAVATAAKPAHGGKSELKPVSQAQPNAGSSAEPDQTSGSSGGGGSSSSSSSSGGAAPAGGGAPSATVKVSADPAQLKFDTTQLTAKAGTVTIDFTNPAPIPHNVHVEQGGKTLGGTKTLANGKATAQLKLKAGSYTFFCSVPGHREAGMQGTLTVK